MIKIWLLNLYFYNDTSVATFVATLIKMLDAAGLDLWKTFCIYVDSFGKCAGR